VGEVRPLPDSEPAPHRKAYHQELEQLRQDVIALAARVTEAVPRGTEVLLTGDLAGAQALIDDDDEIDRMSVALEERVYSVLVRQSPMASELRELVTILKAVSALERSGDLMVNVAKAARRLYGAPLTSRVRGLVTAMSVEARKLLQLAVDAFAERDDALASALADIDDRLDQLNRELVEAIFESQATEDPDVQTAVQLALIARYYERIGDHAVNIGQRVAFMVTGWLPEHTGALRASKRRGRSPAPGTGDDAETGPPR
jgi:phosphate transport system protein